MKKLLLIFTIALLPILAWADDQSGTCGENLIWKYEVATETLIISGTGPMFNYSFINNSIGCDSLIVEE